MGGKNKNKRISSHKSVLFHLKMFKALWINLQGRSLTRKNLLLERTNSFLKWCTGLSPCFAAISTRRKIFDDFLSASLDSHSALLKRGLLLKERICFLFCQFFFLKELTLIEKGGKKMKMAQLLPLKMLRVGDLEEGTPLQGIP